MNKEQQNEIKTVICYPVPTFYSACPYCNKENVSFQHNGVISCQDKYCRKDYIIAKEVVSTNVQKVCG